MTVNNEIGVKQPVGDIGKYSTASGGQVTALLLRFMECFHSQVLLMQKIECAVVKEEMVLSQLKTYLERGMRTKFSTFAAHIVAVTASWCRAAAAFLIFVLNCTMDEKIAWNNWPN